jgi:hypothetical protein
MAKTQKSQKTQKPVADDSQLNDEPIPTEELVQVPASMLKELMDRLEKVENQPAQVTVTTEPSQVQIGRLGQTQGIINKYPVESDYYPNPLDFLYSLPALSRFNLRENYAITYKVEGTTYETKYGAFIHEPLFRLALYRIQFDEDGQPTNKRALVQRTVFTEDELLAKMMASDLGVKLDETDLRSLLNQVRMRRFQTWLEGLFKPRKSIIRAKTTRTEVIGGMPVTVEEWDEAV